MVVYRPRHLICVVCGDAFIGTRSFSKYCKPCGKKRKTESQSACKKRWRENNREKWRKQRRDDYRFGKARGRHLKYHYGISLEDYDEMFRQQNGLCAICEKPEIATNQFGVKRLAVDHDHTTGKIRGLLCQRCNMAIGLMDNNSNLFEAAIQYFGDA